jgi:hypothetical protein
LLSPTERTMRARIGAHCLHSKYDPTTISAPGRKAAAAKLNERLLAEIDPDNSLPEEERARRLEHARRAHFSRLALQRSKKRRAARHV